MTIVEPMRLQGNDKISRKYYLLRCQKGHCYPVSEDYLRAGRLRTCKMCNHPAILEADPEFATWFVDPSIPENGRADVMTKQIFIVSDAVKSYAAKASTTFTSGGRFRVRIA